MNGGVCSLDWLNGDNLVAGCQLDHAIKVVDVEKSFLVKQSLLTDHKVPTCLTTAQDHLVLAGSEDSVVRLFDARTGDKRAAQQLTHSYKGHSKWITSVRFNPQAENVFLSGSIDGTVKLWDLRNDELPLANLKHKS